LTPGTVGNFVGLAEGNLENSKALKAQNFITDQNFRVIPDFMIQGGCPQRNRNRSDKFMMNFTQV
jgi:cyclophilin family peptidyl-prolyl cis-trans isomerase